MVESVNSGYKELATGVVWTAPTQDIHLAADNEWTSLSDEIDNSLLKYLYADIEVVLGSAAFTGGAASLLQIYIVPSLDGTNYPGWIDDVTTAQYLNDDYLVADLHTNSTTAIQRMLSRKVDIPPGKFKFGVRNSTGIALAGSGNDINYRRWGLASA